MADGLEKNGGLTDTAKIAIQKYVFAGVLTVITLFGGLSAILKLSFDADLLKVQQKLVVDLAAMKQKTRLSIDEANENLRLATVGHTEKLNALNEFISDEVDKAARKAAMDASEATVEKFKKQTILTNATQEALSSLIKNANGIGVLEEKTERYKDRLKEAQRNFGALLRAGDQTKIDALTKLLSLRGDTIENLTEVKKYVRESFPCPLDPREIKTGDLDEEHNCIRATATESRASLIKKKTTNPIEETTTTFSLRGMRIVTGVKKISDSVAGRSINFDDDFKYPPVVTVTPAQETQRQRGYPTMYNVTKSGFKVHLIDASRTKAGVFLTTKSYEGFVHYIAIGIASTKE